MGPFLACLEAMRLFTHASPPNHTIGLGCCPLCGILKLYWNIKTVAGCVVKGPACGDFNHKAKVSEADYDLAVTKSSSTAGV